MTGEAKNTDTEIWRGPDEGNGDYYADSLHITASGALGINCGGHVKVRPIRDWFKSVDLESELSLYRGFMESMGYEKVDDGHGSLFRPKPGCPVL